MFNHCEENLMKNITNENCYIKWSILLSFIILPHWIVFNLILKLNQNY